MRKRGRGQTRSSRIRDWALTLIGLAMLAGTVIWLNDLNSQQVLGNARVIDGDSIVVNGREIRLSGIDAPEYRQICVRAGRDWRCGIASRDALRKLVDGRKVDCQTSSVDKFERWLAICQVAGVNVNQTMVEQGWAVDFGGYSAAERKAKDAKRGLWRSEFDRPSVWRELNRGAVAQ